LHRWWVSQVAAAFLEAAGPLSVLGAQLIYFGQPLLRQAVPDGSLRVLAETLETPEESAAFAAYLRSAGWQAAGAETAFPDTEDSAA
jgi:hypothetical protein